MHLAAGISEKSYKHPSATTPTTIIEWKRNVLLRVINLKMNKIWIVACLLTVVAIVFVICSVIFVFHNKTEINIMLEYIFWFFCVLLLFFSSELFNLGVGCVINERNQLKIRGVFNGVVSTCAVGGLSEILSDLLCHLPNSLDLNSVLSEVVKSSGVKDVVSSGCEHCTPLGVSPPIPAAFWVVRINCTLDCLREQDDDVVGFCDFDDTNGLDVCQANIGNRLLAAVEVF